MDLLSYYNNPSVDLRRNVSLYDAMQSQYMGGLDIAKFLQDSSEAGKAVVENLPGIEITGRKGTFSVEKGKVQFVSTKPEVKLPVVQPLPSADLLKFAPLALIPLVLLLVVRKK